MTEMDLERLTDEILLKIGFGDVYRWHMPDEDPFEICGLCRIADGCYRRMPLEVAGAVSERVDRLNENTAGGRVRFATDARKIAIVMHNNAEGFLVNLCDMGESGLDIYADGRHTGTYYAPEEYGVREYPLLAGMKQITIDLPLYNGIDRLFIGIPHGAAIARPKPYINTKPVVYYGSSITQGGCASRAGMSYEQILSRRLNIDYINLGFSGGAKGETRMAEYIAGLDMRSFVMDYDYNAPSEEHLAATHEKFFKIIRKANPDLPILIMSLPNTDMVDRLEDGPRRAAIIETTYRNALAAGDRRVWFIPGRELFGIKDRTDCTVDGCHPTDMGFIRMANRIEPVLKEMLEV